MKEYQCSTMVNAETWGSDLALEEPCRVFISWEPPPRFATVSFEGVLGAGVGVLPLFFGFPDMVF